MTEKRWTGRAENDGQEGQRRDGLEGQKRDGLEGQRSTDRKDIRHVFRSQIQIDAL